MKSHIVSTVTPGGKRKFVLDIRHANKKRERLFFDTRVAAEQEQDALKTQLDVGGALWITLSAREKAEVLLVLKEAHEMGVTLRTLLDHYRGTAPQAAARPGMTLGELIKVVITTKTTSRRRLRYVNNLQSVLKKFAKGRETLPIGMIQTTDIEEWLGAQKGREGKPAAASTISGLINRLSTLFSVAVTKDFLTSNPVDKVERPMVSMAKPKILSPKDASDLLWVCRATDPNFLDYMAIGMFAGVRPEELEKLRWSDIHMDTGEIVIEEAVSKTRQRRVIQMEPVLIEWLKECTPGEFIAPIEANEKRSDETVRQNIRRHRRNLCDRAGVQWHQDILRKTAASYLMQKHENENKVAGLLGNSPKILHSHYRTVVRRQDGDIFWALSPVVVPNTPIELPKGGKGRKRPGKLI